MGTQNLFYFKESKGSHVLGISSGLIRIDFVKVNVLWEIIPKSL